MKHDNETLQTLQTQNYITNITNITNTELQTLQTQNFEKKVFLKKIIMFSLYKIIWKMDAGRIFLKCKLPTSSLSNIYLWMKGSLH